MTARVLLLCSLLIACGGEEANEPHAAPPPGEVEPQIPQPAPVPLDESNRFVQEDLDRFMEQHPDVMRDEERRVYVTCRGDACMPDGPQSSVNAFHGVGARHLVPLWFRACLTGSATGCMYAGRTYQASDLDRRAPIHEGMERDALRTRFRRYIARACDLDEHECTQWADYRLGDDEPSEADVTRAIEVLRRICELGDHHSCAVLARHADDYPAIGPARPWWQRACAASGDARPADDCSRYAQILFATGDPRDRDAAVTALGATCDPDSPAWRRAVEEEGEAAVGTEQWGSGFFWKHGEACLGVAATLPDEAALRLFAAGCVGSLLPEYNTVGLQACNDATRLARRLRRPLAYLANLRRRTCEVEEYVCFERTGMDLAACGAEKTRCIAR